MYRDEVKASRRYTFFMSNLEGLDVFRCFFVNILLFGSLAKILAKFVQFPVKSIDFLFGEFADLLYGLLFLVQCIVAAAEFFNIKGF